MPVARPSDCTEALQRSRSSSCRGPEAAPRARGQVPSSGALDDHLPLELGHRREHVEDELGHGIPARLDVEALRRGDEPDAALQETIDVHSEVERRATEPVELPDHDDVDLPPLCRLQNALEPWAIVLGA
jgi:hypothetical protein